MQVDGIFGLDPAEIEMFLRIGLEIARAALVGLNPAISGLFPEILAVKTRLLPVFPDKAVAALRIRNVEILAVRRFVADADRGVLVAPAHDPVDQARRVGIGED